MPGLSAVLTARWTLQQREAADRAQQDFVAARLSGMGRGEALDLGCGIGRMTETVSRHCERVVGVDGSIGMIRRAVRERGGPRAHFLLASADQLPFRKAQFDVALAFCVLQHIMDDAVYDRAAAEVSRVLRPAGVAMLADGMAGANRHPQRSPAVFRAWDRYAEPWRRTLRLIGKERLVCIHDEYTVSFWRKEERP